MINKINNYQRQQSTKKNYAPSFKAIAINKSNTDLARKIFGDDKYPHRCLQKMVNSKQWKEFLEGIEDFIPTKLKNDFLIIFSPQEIRKLKAAKTNNNKTYLQNIVQNVKETDTKGLLAISNLQYEKASTQTLVRLKEREIEKAFGSGFDTEI